MGVVDFLEKPLDRALLLATLDQAVDGATATDESDDIAPEGDVLDLPHDAVGAAHVRGAIQTMECRFGESNLTVAIVAKERGVSPEHLARLFHARIGHTPTEHLHEIRISHGEHLLAHSRMSVYEVALECGYRRTSEFGSWFRRLRGSPPSGRRKS